VNRGKGLGSAVDGLTQVYVKHVLLKVVSGQLAHMKGGSDEISH